MRTHASEAKGEDNPGSRGGQDLIAHELTYVVQPGTGEVARPRKLKEVGVHEIRKGLSSTNDTLMTTLLANCIAIIAWDWMGTKDAVMGHYHTGLDYNREAQNPFLEGLKKLKGLIERMLESQTEIAYKVCLGTVWMKKSQNAQDNEMEQQLLKAVRSVFEPSDVLYGGTCHFDVNNGEMTCQERNIEFRDKLSDNSRYNEEYGNITEMQRPKEKPNKLGDYCR